jgi:uncharacterized membrane protein
MSYSVTTPRLRPVSRTLAQVHPIDGRHPWRWLAAGWRDLRRAPAWSIGYGTLFVVVGYLIVLGLVMTQTFFLLLPLLGGFLLVAPALGVVPYEISRRLERGERPRVRPMARALRRNSFHITTMGAVLVVAFVTWIMCANLIFALLGGGITPTPENLLPFLLSGENLPMLLVGTAVGAVFALLVFAASAVAVPMLVDRADLDVFSAMQTSLAAFRHNWRPMLLWAALILVFVLGGFLTLLVGLAIGFPLLGHATWHAYRDLVTPVPEAD